MKTSFSLFWSAKLFSNIREKYIKPYYLMKPSFFKLIVIFSYHDFKYIQKYVNIFKSIEAEGEFDTSMLIVCIIYLKATWLLWSIKKKRDSSRSQWLFNHFRWGKHLSPIGLHSLFESGRNAIILFYEQLWWFDLKLNIHLIFMSRDTVIFLQFLKLLQCVYFNMWFNFIF